MSQAKRYGTLCALTERNQLDSAYHAAFYLLSYDKELYEIACKFISHDGIAFSKLKRAVSGFDERSRFIVDIAHNLFSYNSPCKATPFEISRLGYPYMELVCNALYIAAGEVKVEIQSDEKNRAQMSLDAGCYQQTQRIHRRLEQLQGMRTADMEQDEAAGLER
jgi:hypothetical protein